MEYCFIEKWHSGCYLSSDIKAVALTPNASYQMDKAGISYITFADFFSAEEIAGDTDAYLDSQVLWFKEFDQFLLGVFPESKAMNIGLASLYSTRIKCLVDTVVLLSRVLNRFIEIVKPSKIWYMPEIYGEDMVKSWNWFTYGKSPFYRLAPLICHKNNIPFEDLRCQSSVSADNCKEVTAGGSHSGHILWKEAIFANLRIIKNVLLRYRCLFYGSTFNNKRKAINVFVVREYPHTNYFYKDAKLAGFDIFYRVNDNIYKLDWFPGVTKTTIKDSRLEQGKGFVDLNGLLAKSTIMKWVNEQCGLDVSSIFYLRFSYLLGKIFPETIERFKQYVQFYDQFKIDFVINNANSIVDDYASLAAARTTASTKSVCFFHGVDAYKYKMRFFTEYCHFDYLFASTPGEVEYTRETAALLLDKSLEVNEYSYFRDQFLRYRNNIDKQSVKRKKQVILYVPIIKEERTNMFVEGGQFFQWDYFKWHKALVEYFSLREDYCFVWKSLLQELGRGDTIQEMLKDRSSKNIIFSSSSLTKWLSKVDKVICDIPSTAFFESIFAGLPVMTFYSPKAKGIRGNAFSEFKKSLQPYTDVESRLKAVETFLMSEPQEYIIPQGRERIFVPDFLE